MDSTMMPPAANLNVRLRALEQTVLAGAARELDATLRTERLELLDRLPELEATAGRAQAELEDIEAGITAAAAHLVQLQSEAARRRIAAQQAAAPLGPVRRRLLELGDADVDVAERLLDSRRGAIHREIERLRTGRTVGDMTRPPCKLPDAARRIAAEREKIAALDAAAAGIARLRMARLSPMELRTELTNLLHAAGINGAFVAATQFAEEAAPWSIPPWAKNPKTASRAAIA